MARTNICKKIASHYFGNFFTISSHSQTYKDNTADFHLFCFGIFSVANQLKPA